MDASYIVSMIVGLNFNEEDEHTSERMSNTPLGLIYSDRVEEPQNLHMLCIPSLHPWIV